MRYAVRWYLLCRGLVCAMPCRYALCRADRYALCRGFVDNFSARLLVYHAIKPE
jgi:hypothetical protein